MTGESHPVVPVLPVGLYVVFIWLGHGSLRITAVREAPNVNLATSGSRQALVVRTEGEP